MRIDKKFFLIFVLAAVAISFSPVLRNGFVDRDDPAYVTENSYIKNFSGEALLQIFSLPQYQGNYHPLTLTFLAAEYQFFRGDPLGYHAMSILLHMLSCGLVFFLFARLSGDRTVALLIALLFGLHPAHVESVAWASQQKDLLYTGFFLGSLIVYVRFTEKNTAFRYGLSLLLFLFGLLSKGMAVPLPLVLILIDYLKGRKFDRRMVLEKVPFIVLAGIFALIAVAAQQSVGAILDDSRFSTLGRIPLACYAALRYIVKLAIPHDLSAYYPYPAGSVSTLPLGVWVSTAVLIALLILTLRSTRKTRKVVFGAGFFLATIFMVLQILPVGGAFMADRYSYLSSIGIFYLAGELYRVIRDRRPRFSRVLTIALLVYSAAIGSLTFTRSEVWKDSVTLWTDVIGQYPKLGLAYAYRGGGRPLPDEFASAMADLDTAVALAPDLWLAHFNRGYCYASVSRNEEAVREYSLAIGLRDDVGSPRLNRGICYSLMHNYQEAIEDFTAAIRLNPEYPKPYFNRAYAYALAGDHEAAVRDYTRVIELHYLEATACSNRGSSLTSLARYTEAVSDYTRAIALDPSYPEPYFNRANIYLLLESYPRAIQDYSEFLRLRPENPDGLTNRGLARYQSGDRSGACSDLAHAAALNSPRAKAAYEKYCR